GELAATAFECTLGIDADGVHRGVEALGVRDRDIVPGGPAVVGERDVVGVAGEGSERIAQSAWAAAFRERHGTRAGGVEVQPQGHVFRQGVGDEERVGGGRADGRGAYGGR